MASINLDKELDTEDLDPAELRDYTEYLQDIADESEELWDGLEDDSDAAQVVAKSIMKMNDAADTLASNWKKWSDALTDGSAETSE